MVDNETILKTCESLLDETASFLDRLVRFESVSGYEGPAIDWVFEQFRGLADVCEKVPVPENIVNDPDYAFRMDDRPYKDRPNIRVVLKGNGTGKSVIFNAHIDTVPPSEGQERPFDPYVKEGEMYGRGTCDDKGQIAVMWTILKAIQKLGIRPTGDVIFHIVIEEETGGNGTLAFVRRGERADCCINLDGGTSCDIKTSVRGAVWFTGICYGRAGHSGSSQTTVSALKLAIETMSIIEDYHHELLARTISEDPLFAQMENPMPVTFGKIEAGDWPAMVPRKAKFQGVFGFLTTPKEEVMREIVDRVRTRGSPWLRDNFEMTFPYRHDTSRIDPGLPFVKLLQKCYKTMGIASEIGAMPGSGDPWFYTTLLGVPTVQTGAGSLAVAHTAEERVKMSDLVKEAAAMILFIKGWCGLAKR